MQRVPGRQLEQQMQRVPKVGLPKQQVQQQAPAQQEAPKVRQQVLVVQLQREVAMPAQQQQVPQQAQGVAPS